METSDYSFDDFLPIDQISIEPFGLLQNEAKNSASSASSDSSESSLLRNILKIVIVLVILYIGGIAVMEYIKNKSVDHLPIAAAIALMAALFV